MAAKLQNIGVRVCVCVESVRCLCYQDQIKNINWQTTFIKSSHSSLTLWLAFECEHKEHEV